MIDGASPPRGRPQDARRLAEELNRMSLRTLWRFAALGPAWAVCAPRASGQAPTISRETTVAPSGMPGSEASILGPLAGSGGGSFLQTPSGGILGGRPGAATPRVPTSITTPGGGEQVP